MTSTASSSISWRTSDGGHRVAENVLVRVLATPDTEEETAGHQGRRSRRSLGNDRRADAHRRAGHAGAQHESLGALADGADNVPHEGAVTLPVGPWVEVVRDEGEGESCLLGHRRVADKVGRGVLFTRQRKADLVMGR